MGSYHEVASLLYPFFVIPAGRGEHAHNLLLQVWVDLGTFGLVAWVSILLMTLRAAWHMYTSTHTVSWIPALGAGVLCSNVALLIHGMVDAVTWGMIRPAPLVWLVWGIAMAGAARVVASPQPVPVAVQTPTETTTTNTHGTAAHITPS
jgi:putative inorganic carbon (HCO3(-)) transporter